MRSPQVYGTLFKDLRNPLKIWIQFTRRSLYNSSKPTRPEMIIIIKIIPLRRPGRVLMYLALLQCSEMSFPNINQHMF